MIRLLEWRIIKQIRKNYGKGRKRGRSTVTKIKIPPNVSDYKIIKYVKKFHPYCVWSWTTVDEYGRCQISLTRFNPKTMKYKGWYLVKQNTIEKYYLKNKR